jgi:nitrite reductase (NO-forming)
VWLTSRVLVLALSTGHKVGLGVVGAVFILFALGAAILVPRFRPQFPGHGLPAFIVVTLVFFFGMLTAVEVFGAESKGGEEKKAAAPTTSEPTTTAAAPTTTAAPTTAAAKTTTKTKPQTIQVTESEFKIVLAPSSLKAGPVTFQVKNAGAIPHDLAIVGGPKTQLIKPGGSATLTTTLEASPVELYCSVPGHKQAGMDVKTQVS